jgi:hypothetical protein
MDDPGDFWCSLTTLDASRTLGAKPVKLDTFVHTADGHDYANPRLFMLWEFAAAVRYSVKSLF